jgi:hypothetical protein
VEEAKLIPWVYLFDLPGKKQVRVYFMRHFAIPAGHFSFGGVY